MIKKVECGSQTLAFFLFQICKKRFFFPMCYEYYFLIYNELFFLVWSYGIYFCIRISRKNGSKFRSIWIQLLKIEFNKLSGTHFHLSGRFVGCECISYKLDVFNVIKKLVGSRNYKGQNFNWTQQYSLRTNTF